MEAITLYELNSRIRKVLKEEFEGRYWITAEITEIQLNSSGHCYLQLADKREGDEGIVATARATIWAFTFRTLRPYFETTTGRCLAKGVKVMLNVEVVFHELYGYSLNVRDIDPTYTVGDLERKKREILLQLEKEGIIDMNRELEFPLLPKNIAVISSPTAAGLGDFINQLEHNPYGYRFHVKLFPAVMQGDKTADSVIRALERIYEYETLFDVVVIIRGGGSQTDLGSFDSYDMAANVAQFPLPVIAGIGHERDETIVDRVAHSRVKTPTAAAALLIGIFRDQESCAEELQNRFVAGVQELLHDEQTRQLKVVTGFKRGIQAVWMGETSRLKLLSQRLEHDTEAYIRIREIYYGQLKSKMTNSVVRAADRQKSRIQLLTGEVRRKTANAFTKHDRLLELAANTVKYVDPRNVLERGYSITRLNGKAILEAGCLKPGDVIETEMAKGCLRSEVIAMTGGTVPPGDWTD